MDRPGDLVQWNIPKIMNACCQIICTNPWLPCEQLPYPPEHPRISQMRQRDKSDLPLPVLSYKYFLLGYSFSTLSFFSQKSTFLGSGITQRLHGLQQRPFFTNPQIFNLLSYEEMAINFVVPEVSFTALSSVLLLYPCSSAICLTEFFLLFFFSPPKISRIWPIRSLFLPINPTSNVLVR